MHSSIRHEVTTMDIKQMQYFLSVAKTLNISAAASEHFITQPAMSRQIINLESELGVSLLDRTPKGLSLTREGLQFMVYAQDVINRTEQLYADLRGRAEEKKKLKVLIPVEREKFFTDCANIFCEKYPDAHLSVDRIRRPDLEESVRGGRADIYFIWEEDMSRFPELKSTKIVETHHCLVIRKSDIALFKEKGFAGLNGTPFGTADPIVLPARFKQITTLIDVLGIKPSNVTTYSQLSSALIAARSNLLNCIVPVGLISDTANIHIVPLDFEESKLNYFAAYRPKPNPLIEAFIAITKTAGSHLGI